MLFRVTASGRCHVARAGLLCGRVTGVVGSLKPAVDGPRRGGAGKQGLRAGQSRERSKARALPPACAGAGSGPAKGLCPLDPRQGRSPWNPLLERLDGRGDVGRCECCPTEDRRSGSTHDGPRPPSRPTSPTNGLLRLRLSWGSGGNAPGGVQGRSPGLASFMRLPQRHAGNACNPRPRTPKHPAMSGFDSGFAARVKAVLGPTNTGKTHLAIERLLAPFLRHHRLPAAPAGARELRPHGGPQGRPPRRADHRRGEDRPARRPLVLLHRRGHAAGPRRRVRRGGRDPALRRPGPRPRLHRPPAACARHGRDHVSRRRDHPPAAAAPGAAGRHRDPAAPVATDLCRPGQAVRLPPRTRRGRVQRRRGLRDRRADPPPARRLRGGDGAPVARAPATPRWRCTRTRRSISWSPPTPSAWA